MNDEYATAKTANPSQTDMAITRLNEATSILDDLYKVLDSTYCSLYGSEPKPENKDVVRTPTPGQLGIINDSVYGILERSKKCLDLAGRTKSKI